MSDERRKHRCTDQPCTRLVDEVHDLVDPYSHVERRMLRKGKREIAKHHRTNWPGLLAQLRANLDPGSTGDDVPGLAVTESRPPVDLPALNALLRIETESADWITRRLHRLGRPRQLLRDTVEDNLRLLVGEAAMLGREQRPLCSAVHRWWTWCRVESAWDAPARESRDPCPYCGNRSLRIRPDGSAAWCTEDGESWDADTVGLLAGMLAAASQQREQEAADARERARNLRFAGGAA